MKKLSFIVMLSMVLLLSACSGNGGGNLTKDGKENGAGQESPGQKQAEGKQKTVAVSVLRIDRFLENAVRVFEEKYADIRIELKEYKASDGTGTSGMAMEAADIEKYVQSVTTQVISGKGSDLILMNNLPQDKFVAKKLLVNLYDLIDKDSSFDQDALYPNILKASQDGDGLYVMPLAFSLETAQGNTELLKQANISVDKNSPWSWSQFKDVAIKMKQQGEREGYYYNLIMSPLLHDYIEDNYAELVGQGKPNFDSDLFRNMMKEIKSIYDEGLLSEGFASDAGEAVVQIVGIFSPRGALMMPSNFEYYQKPSARGNKEGVPFKSMYSLGMNSKSDVQPEAWEFMKFLLSDDMQASPDLFGLAMNKDATDKKLNEVLQQIENGTLEFPFPEDTLPDGEMTKQRISEIQKLISEAGARKSSDIKVLTIATEEFESYKNGQKSAEEVSKLIQNRVTTYLNE
ncbi:ABC transporter substrate-binding protein [Paenibacillus paeoniae]|uniref:ABC transporter substrate-binding protein n=1 Tax=Paenibacillus paeoniae TaxID=2292705 RepID=UPI0014026179|nr:extracellular solute-binding protein [Paenibacillus paeoniae]